MPLRGASVEHGPHLFCSFRNANFLCIHRSTENWKMQGLCKKWNALRKNFSLDKEHFPGVYCIYIEKSCERDGTQARAQKRTEITG